jgi:hypothetical protein
MSELSRIPESTVSARRLIHLLESVALGNSPDEDVVCEAICAFVRELKAEGSAPERVLVTVKDVIAAADTNRDSDQQRRFLQQVITW